MKCIVCGALEVNAYLDERLVQCAECSLVRAADHYFSLQPSAVYTDVYFQGLAYVPGETEYVDYQRERQALACNFHRRIAILRGLAGNAKRLVEIGSGYGFFLELAGRYWEVEGFEISEHAARQAQRLGARCICADYLLHDGRASVPDIACLWDTIEHLASPRHVLEKLAADLPPQGLIAISTGDIGAILPRLQGRHWRLIHPPTHLWYFSLPTLVQLLREVGFEPVKIVYPFYYRSLRTCIGKLSHYLPRRLGDWPIPIQTGDLMEVYAQKVGANPQRVLTGTDQQD